MYRDRQYRTDTSTLQTSRWVVKSSTLKNQTRGMQNLTAWGLIVLARPASLPFPSVPGIPQVEAILRRVCYLRCSQVEDQQRWKTSQKKLRVDVSLCLNPTSSSNSSYVYIFWGHSDDNLMILASEPKVIRVLCLVLIYCFKGLGSPTFFIRGLDPWLACSLRPDTKDARSNYLWIVLNCNTKKADSVKFYMKLYEE